MFINRFRFPLGALALAAAALAPLAQAQTRAPYPPTPVQPVRDNYHGTEVVDPYRWMEDMSSAQFQQWLRAQAHYAAADLATIPGRAALRQRLGELADAGESTGAYRMVAGQLFYMKREPGQNQSRLVLRQGLAGAERTLLDPMNVPGQPGKHAIDWYAPSPDGRLVAVGLSAGGSENSVLRVLDVATGKLRPLAIDRTGLNEGGVAWLPDSSGFAYNRHPADERYNKSAVFLHRLGQDVAQDRAVFGWQVDAKMPFEIADLPHMRLSKDGRWALAEVLHGDAAERSYWAAPLAALQKGRKLQWQRLVSPQDKIIEAALVGDELYAISQAKASRRELLVRKLGTARAPWKTALPAGQSVLQDIHGASDAVYVKALDAGVTKLWRVPRRGHAAPASVALPFEGTLRAFAALPKGELLVQMVGWTQAPQSLVINPKTQQSRVVDVQKPTQLDTSGFQAERVMVPSHDGVRVPLSILSAKNTPRDGRRPTIVSGYGAYGISQEPNFTPTRLAWLERGGVQAICHVRGGGELGADWHRGGYIATKQNTVSDFIACAQYLIAQGYTNSAQLAGTGGSAGGITIGGAITQRPELFAAAQTAVSVSDMLRMEFTPNGPPNIAEFGTVTNPEHFKSMYAISPYHRVKDGTRYPAVIATTGANDPRVEAWMPGKMAARLQAANPESYRERPVLLRVDYEAGHGMGSGVSQRLDETADVWSFFLRQFGDPAFQPKP
ncbi:prolyl oligopeptidase family serine peptidase [Roseateles sp. BYS180W]|uniref:prolyl oligopeptidase n=1 Tax=Roseateles rivi TaxID=3299028 RepID=A0ABW7FW75_9BURK